ncbi:MAG: hypothetical protein RL380_574 [Verrucomicrobiota bacterium]|jgi:hypothetical protein
MKKVLLSCILAAAALFTGCQATITNLSPHYQVRRADGLYPVAASFDTRQGSLRWDSLKPYVIVGDTTYPMRLMPLMTNRWETLVPVPAGANQVAFRYKFDWQYNAIPSPLNDSMTTKPQVLRVLGN